MKTTKKNESTVKSERAVRFYKKASFPWAIIVIAVVFFGGLVLGWNLRSEQASSIKAEVMSQLETAEVAKKANQ